MCPMLEGRSSPLSQGFSFEGLGSASEQVDKTFWPSDSHYLPEGTAPSSPGARSPRSGRCNCSGSGRPPGRTWHFSSEFGDLVQSWAMGWGWVTAAPCYSASLSPPYKANAGNTVHPEIWNIWAGIFWMHLKRGGREEGCREEHEKERATALLV